MASEPSLDWREQAMKILGEEGAVRTKALKQECAFMVKEARRPKWQSGEVERQGGRACGKGGTGPVL